MTQFSDDLALLESMVDWDVMKAATQSTDPESLPALLATGTRRDDFSLVEQAVLRGLGVDRLDFVPAVPRESVVPERVRKQRAREVAENARLAAAKHTP